MMKNPRAIAVELETFKRQHKGGEIITDAVSALREMADELDELREQSAMFKRVIRWVKKTVGRHMDGMQFVERKKHNGGRLEYKILRKPSASEKVNFDSLMMRCENMIPDSGVWRRV